MAAERHGRRGGGIDRDELSHSEALDCDDTIESRKKNDTTITSLRTHRDGFQKVVIIDVYTFSNANTGMPHVKSTGRHDTLSAGPI